MSKQTQNYRIWHLYQSLDLSENKALGNGVGIKPTISSNPNCCYNHQATQTPRSTPTAPQIDTYVPDPVQPRGLLTTPNSHYNRHYSLIRQCCT